MIVWRGAVYIYMMLFMERVNSKSPPNRRFFMTRRRHRNTHRKKIFFSCKRIFWNVIKINLCWVKDFVSFPFFLFVNWIEVGNYIELRLWNADKKRKKGEIDYLLSLLALNTEQKWNIEIKKIAFGVKDGRFLEFFLWGK